MPAIPRLPGLALALGLLAAAAPAAHADDEGSEHTATLMGADDDTRGLSLAFTDSAGWIATYRSAPGATAVTLRLPLPRDHAHFVAHVAPGRRGFVIVEVSMGWSRPTTLPATRPVAWHFDRRGRLTRTWRYDQMLLPATRAAARVSAGHVDWTNAVTVRGGSLVLGTSDGRHEVVVDTSRAAIRLVARPAVP
ncbi:MAG: hypothetical protein KBG28_13610 [Kofleriaceae bacterium]|nr:hypothetical protein [Kofleriaceae bacterium]